MPTDHGFRRLRACAEQASLDAGDRTAEPRKRWPTVGVGLHLLSLAFAGTVAHASLAGMTDDPRIAPDPSRSAQRYASWPRSRPSR